MFYNLFDSHMHSEHSFDGNDPVEMLCTQAVKNGLTGVCITDHCELSIYEDGQFAHSIAKSVKASQQAKLDFAGRLAVLTGIELSDVLHEPALTEQVLAAHEFDFVLLSQHSLNSYDDIYETDYSAMTMAEIDASLEAYYQKLLECVKWNRYDSVAHLTYPIRYITGKYKITVNLHKLDDIMDELLKMVIDHGKAIEINTSGLWQPLADFMPPRDYIARYRSFGGELITLGSDTHFANTAGKGIQEAMQLLEQEGFSYFTVYKNRSPIQMKLL